VATKTDGRKIGLGELALDRATELDAMADQRKDEATDLWGRELFLGDTALRLLDEGAYFASTARIIRKLVAELP
jgi:hypothetical protein